MSKLVIYVMFSFMLRNGQLVVYQPGDVVYQKDMQAEDFDALVSHAVSLKYGKDSSAGIDPPDYVLEAQARRLRGDDVSLIQRDLLIAASGGGGGGVGL